MSFTFVSTSLWIPSCDKCNNNSSSSKRIFTNSWYVSNRFQFAIIYTWTISSLTFRVCVCMRRRINWHAQCSYQISSHFVVKFRKIRNHLHIASECVCFCDILASLLITVNDSMMLSIFEQAKKLVAKCIVWHIWVYCTGRLSKTAFLFLFFHFNCLTASHHSLVECFQYCVEKFFACFCVVHLKFKNLTKKFATSTPIEWAQ